MKDIFVGFNIGIISGLLLALIFVNIDISRFVNKDKLANKQTILVEGVYHQYSSVRSFPK